MSEQGLVGKFRSVTWQSPIGPLHDVGIHDGCKWCADELAAALKRIETNVDKQAYRNSHGVMCITVERLRAIVRRELGE